MAVNRPGSFLTASEWVTEDLGVWFMKARHVYPFFLPVPLTREALAGPLNPQHATSETCWGWVRPLKQENAGRRPALIPPHPVIGSLMRVFRSLATHTPACSPHVNNAVQTSGKGYYDMGSIPHHPPP